MKFPKTKMLIEYWNVASRSAIDSVLKEEKKNTNSEQISHH